jgi:hypothetical protein
LLLEAVRAADNSYGGTQFAPLIAGIIGALGGIMGLVRLLGFTTLACGCVVGRYREVASNREVTYVEEKGESCCAQGHRRNHTVVPDRPVTIAPAALAAAKIA